MTVQRRSPGLDPDKWTTIDLARLIAQRHISPVEAVQAYLDRIERLDPVLGAYITVAGDQAMADARRAEEAVMRGGGLRPLHGVPLGLKDQFDTCGLRTTAGSRNLDQNIPTRDATVVQRLKDAGGIVLGKLNMTQFAWGGGDPFQYRHPARNPWNLDHGANGSSTGSAIAVAASLCAFALGGDTGGSIRGPASACGITGLRPSWGLVSRYGSFPASWSMDTTGPMTRTAADAALVLNIIAGYDPHDPLTTRQSMPDYLKGLDVPLTGMRIGIISEFMAPEAADLPVRSAVAEAAAVLTSLGAEIDEVSLPLLTEAGPVQVLIGGSETAFVHRQALRRTPGHFGDGLRRSLLASSLLPYTVIEKARRIQALFRREWLDLYRRFDVLISPAVPYLTGRLDAVSATGKLGRPKANTMAPATLAGAPGLSVPCGFDENGVPMGLQIHAAPFRDDLTLRVGHAFQEVTDWHRRRPSLSFE